MQKPFDEESRELKKEIARTFVPLVNKVKGVYASLDRTVDIPFGAGLLMFNEGCKEMEKSTGSDVNSLEKLHIEHRVGNPFFCNTLTIKADAKLELDPHWRASSAARRRIRSPRATLGQF